MDLIFLQDHTDFVFITDIMLGLNVGITLQPTKWKWEEFSDKPSFLSAEMSYIGIKLAQYFFFDTILSFSANQTILNNSLTTSIQFWTFKYSSKYRSPH